MNDREKLIALIRECNKFHEAAKEKWILGGKQGERPSLIASLADHLLANGVTIPTRCKDCKYKFSANGHNKDGCPLDGVGLMHDDDFCSCGERRIE